MFGWYRMPKSGHPYYGPVPEGVEVLDGPPAVEPSAAPQPPAKSASKAEWVAYAVERGWAPEDAGRKTKAALVAELGEQDVDALEGEGTVGSEVPAVDLGSQPGEVGAVPAVPSSDDGLDGDLERHED